MSWVSLCVGLSQSLVSGPQRACLSNGQPHRPVTFNQSSMDVAQGQGGGRGGRGGRKKGRGGRKKGRGRKRSVEGGVWREEYGGRSGEECGRSSVEGEAEWGLSEEEDQVSEVSWSQS